MKKYFLLQCKRLARYLPGAFMATVILLGGLAAVLGITVDQQAQKAENQKFQIGVVGSLEDPLLQMGVEAIRNYDSSRFAMELLPMEEEQAKKDLATGKLSAYLVVPEDFMDEARYGNILPLRFVSTVGGSGLSTIVQQEITTAISQVLIGAQQGVFGMYTATAENGVNGGPAMTPMALEYTEYVLARDQLYRVENLGIGDGLELDTYLLCGFLVVLLMLGSLPFASGMIRRDVALGQMLTARGRPAFLQTLCDYAAYSLAQLALVLALAAVAVCVPQLRSFGKLLLWSLPVVALSAAVSYLLYSLATDLIGGVLLQFFVTLAMCFVSGCLYPVFFFPAALQKVAMWLPTGVARRMLAGVLTGGADWTAVLVLAIYSAAFFLAGSHVNCRRIRGVSR